ncbi:hypothetical protein A9995_03845 [Erythrobacter sp. QSSC1-22B]|uniref:hypothetical protein n=1 Tax=Erythrobacter sp. QSSC1-22B TaxID=1860125 RepID=UPI000805109A|nr:hypothetical protein [Erythrobacter sp. QSSC1-22B]OBX19710.1 hypothetical protein A9995_03845 [Erythrobacter sp. QSSC1-22B]
MEIDRPPRPTLSLNIGITGHRAAIFTPEILRHIGPVLDTLFADLFAAVQKLHSVEASIFDPCDPILRLHTPLAAGADQLAATTAHAAGFCVRALLPFPVETYQLDFQGSELVEFQKQLQCADAIFTMPGDYGSPKAYTMVGKAVIAASDILVAIWDGLPANGPGGTAQIVEMAMDENLPVIHIPIDRANDTVGSPRLRGNFVPGMQNTGALDKDDYFALVNSVLAPHDSVDRKYIGQYFKETERRINGRLEYPLLLSVLGVKALDKPWLQNSIEDDIERDWSMTRDAYPPSLRMPLERSYGWSNFLAIRYAQRFRSGHVANYVLSALAVLIALTGLLLPGFKLYLVLAELAVIGLLFLNTRAGNKGEWHRRWLQYRYLAESLRPLVYLKRIGLGAPPFRSDEISPSANRTKTNRNWTRWYAAAIWREMSSPIGGVSEAGISALTEAVITECFKPQANYHRVNAHRMRHLDHRLHVIGSTLMGLVIGACVLFVIGYFLVPSLIADMSIGLVVLTAGLPAAGAAVFGMRGHGEHLLQASRSAETAIALDASAQRLSKVTDLETLSTELCRAAAIMLADLDEWTTSYSERSLEIPA